MEKEGEDAGVQPVGDQDPAQAHEGYRALEIFIMTEDFIHLIFDLKSIIFVFGTFREVLIPSISVRVNQPCI